MKIRTFIVALVAVLAGMPFNSMADPPLVYNVENTGTNFAGITNLPSMSQLPFVQPLPDPFMWLSSLTNRTFNSRSTNFVDWEQHRNEIAALIQNYEIGPKPMVDPSQITASYTNGTLTVNVTVGANTLTLTCPVALPSGSGPFPVCIGMDSPYGSLPSGMFSGRNIAGIAYSESQVTTYGNPQISNPYYKLYPNLNPSNTGQYSAWAWGVSRIIDGLYKLNGVLGTAQIDLNHIAVTGCSYAGKLALFSGAFDERIALTVAQESGGGGANSWRYNHTQPSGTVEDIDNTDYNWFEDSMTQFSGNNVSYLPEDHHELDAMVAPRALYVTGNTDYTWLGNPSCYVCSRAAQQIFSTLGISDRFGFNVDGGHSHCTFPPDQTNDLAYFLDKFMLGKTNLSSVIATSSVNVNYAGWIQWWGTGGPSFPQFFVNLPAAATEGAGTLAGQASIGFNRVALTNLVLNLTSSDTTEVTVPASVVIPTGQTNVVFDLTILDDGVPSGDQMVTITATNADFAVTAKANITIHDAETATLSVALPASASKSAGTVANAGSVSVGVPVGPNVTVSLTSSDPSKLTVPANVVIPSGQTSAVFDLNVVDDNIIDGPQNASVTAHVPNWTDGSASMTILDSNPLPDHFVWSAVPSPQWAGGPFHVTITAQDASNNVVDFRLPITLSALIPGSATGTNTLLNSPATDQSATDPPDYPDYSLGYSFTANTNLYVTHVRSYFGDKISIWGSSGLLLTTQAVVSVPGTWVDTPLSAPVLIPAGTICRVAAHEYGVEYFWGTSLPNTFANGTINTTYWDSGDVFPQTADPFTQWYYVDVRYGTDLAQASINPVAAATFTNGVWSGNLAVLQAGTNVCLEAVAGPGSSGASGAFNVIAAPKLTIGALGNSVVLSWPTNTAGFNLEQSSTMSNWTNDPVTPVIAGSSYNVTNTPGPAPLYYRLHKP